MKQLLIQYLPFAVFAICLLSFHIWKWDFFSKALSDKGFPSATRIGGYVLVLVIAFCEVYLTMKTQTFDLDHLKVILGGVLVLYGLVKVESLMAIWKGTKVPEPPTEPTPNEAA